MTLLSWANIHIEDIKNRLKDADFQKVVWLVNRTPSLANFSIRKDKLKLLFWIFHWFIILYVDGSKAVSGLLESSENAIESYLNVLLFILYSNIFWWWLLKLPVLMKVLKGLEDNNKIFQNPDTEKNHIRYLRNIKFIIMIYFAFMCMEETFIFMPKRTEIRDGSSIMPCPGMMHLMESMPCKWTCKFFLAMNEICIFITIVCYPPLTFFTIVHTSIMFHLLTQELSMMNLSRFDSAEEHKLYVKTRLPKLIQRHDLILEVYRNLKSLYSVSIAVDLSMIVLCIGLCLYMPSEDFFGYFPVLTYCFIDFFSYCMLGQYLTNASERFERAVYGCGWESFDLPEKKLIYFTLIQAQNPVVLLAGDVTPLNMYTFQSTMQFMYKFFAIFLKSF